MPLPNAVKLNMQPEEFLPIQLLIVGTNRVWITDEDVEIDSRNVYCPKMTNQSTFQLIQRPYPDILVKMCLSPKWFLLTDGVK